jgi:hypothetical protein
MVKLKFVLTPAFVFVLLACPLFVISNKALSASNYAAPTERITLFNSTRHANHNDYKKSIVSFRLDTSYKVETGPNTDWDLRYGGLSFNGDRDWFITAFGRRDRNRIRDLGKLDWSDDIMIPVLPILPCQTNEPCGRIQIPPASTSKQIQDEDVNPHIAKPVVGHMYLIHVYEEKRPASPPRPPDPPRLEILFDFYTLVRVEELKPNESCTITWKRIATPKQ